MSWNSAQRVVVVVAYGLALWVIWGWVESAGWQQFGDNPGWYNYAPNSGVVFSDGLPELRTNLALRVAAQLALVGLWAVPSVWLLRTITRSTGSESPATQD